MPYTKTESDPVYSWCVEEGNYRSPDVVALAVGLPVAHEAGARLVEELVAVGALEAGCMPLQVRGHA